MTPDDVLREASRYRLSMAIRAAAELGVADHLGEAPVTAAEVAQSLRADPALLRRLLRALASEGIFIEHPDGRFSTNEAGRVLESGAQRDFIVGWTGFQPTYAAFGQLAEAVRTGRKPFELAHGTDFESFLDQRPELRAQYDRAMAATDEGFQAAVEGYDFGRFTTVLDVGGGTGAFLTHLLRRHDHLRGILFDRPGTVAGVELAPEVAERITVVGGDFFSRPLPQADCIVLSTVLRLFDDDSATQLLSACAAAMSAESALVAIDFVHPPGPLPPRYGLADLQALCAYGGQDRTEAEFAALFAAAGLTLTRVIQSTAVHAYVEGRRAAS